MVQPPQKPNASKKRQLRMEIPANLSAIYANGAIISQTHSEIIFDFVQIMPNDPRARVQSRVAMTPANAKLLMNALKTHIERFEGRHGEITLPPKPETLADQLFGAVKPEDEVDGDGEDDN